MSKAFLKLPITAICAVLLLTACSKSEQQAETPPSPASVAETQAVPMSAKPADDKAVPVVVPASVPTNTATATTNDVKETITIASIPADATEPPEEEADNSDMENITEDAPVIDDEPASPDAPKDPNAKQDNGNAKISN